jgi:hypothetical protein
MTTGLNDALIRVLALASGMAAGAVIGLTLAVTLTPADTPKQTQLFLVVQASARLDRI